MCLLIFSSNVRHVDGKYYDAFITCVHSDMTYDVYYTEDPECAGSKIKHCHVKLPIQTARNVEFKHWDLYHGQVFYDSGTKKGEDPTDPDFCMEPGEWVVDHVTSNNCFVCLRLGQPHRDENNTDFDIGYVMRMIRKYEEE